MQLYRQTFDTIMGVKKEASRHEQKLLEKARYYIKKISWIPGIEMIAVANSLSMFATHKNSDIDLFIITKPGNIWLVRFMITMVFWLLGVWRHGEDIAGNFCLSFFVTTDSMDMTKIALDTDIYLYYWIYYMKPIMVRGNIYEQFLKANSWIEIDFSQKIKNTEYIAIQKAPQESYKVFEYIDKCICYILIPRTLRNYKKIGEPEGVIISKNILKFHNHDRRREIRDKILKKNFDK